MGHENGVRYLFCYGGPRPDSYATNYTIKYPWKWVLSFPGITADYPKGGGTSIPESLAVVVQGKCQVNSSVKMSVEGSFIWANNFL